MTADTVGIYDVVGARLQRSAEWGQTQRMPWQTCFGSVNGIGGCARAIWDRLRGLVVRLSGTIMFRTASWESGVVRNTRA